MESQKEKEIIKNQFIEELNKMKPNLEDKDLNNKILQISKNFQVEHSKRDLTFPKNEVMNHCNLDFDINLVNNKNHPCSNHNIGHIIIGGLRIPGMKMKKNQNDLWKGSLGVCIEKNNISHLITYEFSVHLNDDTYNDACKKGNINLKRNDINDHFLVQSIFYNKGIELIM